MKSHWKVIQHSTTLALEQSTLSGPSPAPFQLPAPAAVSPKPASHITSSKIRHPPCCRRAQSAVQWGGGEAGSWVSWCPPPLHVHAAWLYVTHQPRHMPSCEWHYYIEDHKSIGDDSKEVPYASAASSWHHRQQRQQQLRTAAVPHPLRSRSGSQSRWHPRVRPARSRCFGSWPWQLGATVPAGER